jgi:phage head maturation protease
VHALMKAGALDGLSIGFRAVKTRADRKTGVVGVFFAQMQDYAMLEKLRNAVRDAVDRALSR